MASDSEPRTKRTAKRHDCGKQYWPFDFRVSVRKCSATTGAFRREGVLVELTAHGWGREVRAIPGLIIAELTASEIIVVRQVAAEIATLSGDASPSALHAGEAEAIVLAERGTPKFDVVLLDEQAARQVAESRGLAISGFPGTLLMAVESRLITPDQLKQRLEDCIRQGTHYGTKFVHSVYREARRRWSST